MDKRLGIVLAVIVLILVLGGIFMYSKNNGSPAPTQTISNTQTTPTETVTVMMGQDSYEPKDLTIKKGTQVIFKNSASDLRWPASNLHPSHLIYPEFDPKQPVEVGAEWAFTFEKVGDWKYHDHLAPLITGKITVTE